MALSTELLNTLWNLLLVFHHLFVLDTTGMLCLI